MTAWISFESVPAGILSAVSEDIPAGVFCAVSTGAMTGTAQAAMTAINADAINRKMLFFADNLIYTLPFFFDPGIFKRQVRKSGRDRPIRSG